MMGSFSVPIFQPIRLSNGTQIEEFMCRILYAHTDAIRWERSHIKDINSLHLSQDLKTFETSRLFEISGDGSGFGTGR
jgi:hypothetical protein